MQLLNRTNQFFMCFIRIISNIAISHGISMNNRITFTLIMIFFTALFITLFIISDPAIASVDSKREKQITCVVVKEGDTLWELAKKYYTEEYGNLSLFIYEIKKCNGISDTIYSGQKLLIPYYCSV